jgi:ankyrin repeat protein
MPPKRKAQVSAVELQQEHSHDEDSKNKRANSTKGKKHQQPGLDLDCKDSINLPPLPPPPQGNDPIITQFKPVKGQWGLNDENINRIGPKTGNTILHNYCQHINTTPLEVYRYLIETKGCDVNAQDKENNTPFHTALYRFNPNEGGNITVLMYLLTQTNINVNTKGWNDETLLHTACENINALPLDVFKLLIETHGCDVNAQAEDNNTPLYYALACFDPNKGGNITVLTYLINQKGVNGDTKGRNGNTLLHIACIKINSLPIEMFKFLIETIGCDVNTQDENKDTPIHRALRCFDPNNGGDITVLTYLLSQMNVNVNTKGYNDHTILHLTCEKINNLPLEIFKLLIETNGCDVNAQDKDNDTPVHFAFHCFNPNDGGNITVLIYLLTQTNINVNTKGFNGETLLHTACEKINSLPLDIFKLLIETKGCDVDAQNNNKNTPIHSALVCFDPNEGSDIAVLTYLLSQKGVNGDTNDKSFYTLLRLTCNNINRIPIEIFQNLIETFGYDVNSQDNSKDIPLHNALRCFDPNKGGDISVLQYLFTQTNINVNTKGFNGEILLHTACEKINKLPLEIFQYLIETKGCDVDAQNNNKNTPLQNALRCFDPNEGGDITVLTYLLSQKGVNGDTNDKSFYTLLDRACNNINRIPLEIFKVLIETHGYDVNSQDNDKNTPLHYALRFFDPRNGGDITVLTYLLSQKGVNGDTKSKDGGTLLHYACENINKLPLEIFQYLIETVGCDVNVEDNKKDTPIHRAIDCFEPNKGGDISVLQYLSNQTNTKGKSGDTLLHYACEKINIRSLDVFKVLIETHGFDVNAQNNNKDTPLHLALCCFDPNNGGDITVLTYLLNQKDINGKVKGKDDYTLLHYACGNINKLPLDVFKLLIETVGVDVNVQDNNKNTPLHNALDCVDPNKGSNITVLHFLLSQKGIDGNIKGKDGDTLLHMVCKYIKRLPLEIFKLLIETVGCDINARNKGNDTPLHNALLCFNPNKGGDLTILNYLLNQKGLSVNVVGKYGRTLLHIACQNINRIPLDVFKLLIEKYGADVNAQNSNKGHPLHLAFRSFNPNVNGSIVALTYLLTLEGIDGNVKGKNRDTLLHMVCKQISILPHEVFQHLIETIGCDVNAQNNDKNTPIHVALHSFNPNKGHDIAILTYLLSQKGIHGDTKGQCGDSILHTACDNINSFPIDIFQLLIETVGCNVNVRNKHQNTPLQNALCCFDPNKGGDIKALAYLIDQKNVNLYVKGKKGFNLLHLICINNLPRNRRSAQLDPQFDSNSCQIVEIIAERLVQQVLDETTP